MLPNPINVNLDYTFIRIAINYLERENCIIHFDTNCAHMLKISVLNL